MNRIANNIVSVLGDGYVFRTGLVEHVAIRGRSFPAPLETRRENESALIPNLPRAPARLCILDINLLAVNSGCAVDQGETRPGSANHRMFQARD